MEGTDSGGHRERRRMVKTVQQASKDIRRGFRTTDEEIVPNSGKAKDVIQSGHVSQTGYVI